MKTLAQNVTIWIAAAAWARITEWVKLAHDYEVSGLGLVEETLDRAGRLAGYLVTEVFLPAQVNGRTSTELEPASIASLMLEVEEATGASERLRFWWHYHPGGIGLMWSSTDDDCVEELRNGAWFLSTVFNPQMECRTRLDLFAPVRVTLDELPTRIQLPDQGIADECAALFRERVTRHVPLPIGRPGLFTLPRSAALFDTASHPDHRPTREEILAAEILVDEGELSFAEYCALVERDETWLDRFGPPPEEMEDPCDSGDRRGSLTEPGSPRSR